MGECCLCHGYASPDYEYGGTYYCQECIEKCLPIFNHFKAKITQLKKAQYDRIRKIYLQNDLDMTIAQLNTLKKELLI